VFRRRQNEEVTPDSDAGAAAVQERYARFARNEAPGRSERYREWSAGVAADPAVQKMLARIPAEHRQPPLVFAVSRLLGVASDAGYPAWAQWALTHADALVGECTRRTVQTNEPLRCAALLPALAGIPGPLALLEVGASAGLCLYPDRYSYRYRRPDGSVHAIDPPEGVSDVVLECELRGPELPPASMPEIVWRAGIDLAPLDPGAAETEAWLTGLVWPGEEGRAERVRAALRIAASDPPRLVQADAVGALAEVAAGAPRDATLVVTTPGVLAYLPWPQRHSLIDAARAAGRWVTIDPPSLHEGWTAPIDRDSWPGGFAVAVDGRVVAAADPLGGWLEWLPRLDASAG
jgi:hypothetical protein